MAYQPYFYQEETQDRLLVRLINEANPGLNLSPIALSNTRLGKPWKITPKEGSIADTAVEVFPRDNTFFVGRVVVYYRRIDVERLFAHNVPTFDRWREGNATTNDVLEWFNQRYGTVFLPNEMGYTTYPSDTGVRERYMIGDSLCYQGKLRWRWIKGKRAFDQILQTSDFTGRYWDQRHGGASDPRPLMTLMGYGNDYSDFAENISRISNGVSADSAGGFIQGLIKRFNDTTGMDLTTGEQHTAPQGLGGLIVTRHTLPTTTLPEANSERFQNALAITSQDTSWFGGRLLFHYNLASVQMAQAVFRGLVLTPVFYAKTPGITVDEPVTWQLVERDNLIPAEQKSLLTGTFPARKLPTTVEVAETLSPPTVEGYHVRVELRNRSNVLMAVSDYAHFVPDVVIAPSTTAVRYDQDISFEITQTDFVAGTTYYWSAEAVDGSFKQAVTGTFEPLNVTDTLTLTIPSTAATTLGTTWRLVLRSDAIDGEIIGKSNPIAMNDVNGTREASSGGSMTIPLYARRVQIRLEAAGGGGGGTMQYGDGSGGRGGDGGDLTITRAVTGGESLSWTIGRGGSPGGIWSEAPGQDGGDSTMTLLGQTYTVLGGGGGQPAMYSSGANGIDRGNGGRGGDGAYSVDNSSIDRAGSSGENGSIVVEWFGW